MVRWTLLTALTLRQTLLVSELVQTGVYFSGGDTDTLVSISTFTPTTTLEGQSVQIVGLVMEGTIGRGRPLS